MKNMLYSGDRSVLEAFEKTRGKLQPGIHVGGDPRLESGNWRSRIFKKEGFVLSKGSFQLRRDAIWQLVTPHDSLMLVMVLKGGLECKPIDKPVVWLGENQYHLCRWEAAEAHLMRASPGFNQLIILEMTQDFIAYLLQQNIQIKRNGRLLDMNLITHPFEVIGNISYAMHHVLYHLDFPEKPTLAIRTPEVKYLERLITLMLSDFAKKGDVRIDELILYINSRLDEKLPLQELCHRTGMSEAYLRKKFKHMTGLSLRSFILNRKMRKAMDLIIHSGMSIGQISVEVGYLNLISFEKTFISRYGHAPSFFRDTYRDKDQKV